MQLLVSRTIRASRARSKHQTFSRVWPRSNECPQYTVYIYMCVQFTHLCVCVERLTALSYSGIVFNENFLPHVTAGELHSDVRATRLLRRLLDDRSLVGSRRRGSTAGPLAKRPHTCQSCHPRRQQGRPRAQSSCAH